MISATKLLYNSELYKIQGGFLLILMKVTFSDCFLVK